MAKLKLFKTTSGFKDSYVATTSRAKALEAWGARTDLFAIGAAEEVDNPAILREAASAPGTVLQRSKAKAAGKLAPAHKKPKVDRSKLEKAVADAKRKLASAEKARDEELARIDANLAALTDQREKAAGKHERAVERLHAAVESARSKL